MRPSSAPFGQPALNADMVSQFANTNAGAASHRDARLGITQNSDASGLNSSTGSSLSHQDNYLRSSQQQQQRLSWMQQSSQPEEDEQQLDAEEHANSSYNHHQQSYHHTDDDGGDGPDEQSHEEQQFSVEQQQHPDDDEDPHHDDDAQHHDEEQDADSSIDGSNSAKKKKVDRVQVAVRCRPLLPSEQINAAPVGRAVGLSSAAGSSKLCVHVQNNQVLLSKSRVFQFDHAFGPEVSQVDMYSTCGKELVSAAFQGYNATIFAYGQTGSGKTFTMGSGNNSCIAEDDLGIIPRVVHDIYNQVARLKKKGIQVLTRVSYLEIYQEELKDLLHPTGSNTTGKNANNAPAISIREEAGGGVVVVGVREELVANFGDMMRVLTRGSISRTTGSTLMNAHSSRSHSIFTINIEQKKRLLGDANRKMDLNASFKNEIIRSKIHLVDLAGSERAKRTGAQGVRFKESININRGLLALGNVIQALSSQQQANRSSADPYASSRHVPYRESKLTRLLQGSLGGNSRTLMIACVSPSERNFEETHTTLKYAQRARNIRNTPVVNRREELVVPPPVVVDTNTNQSPAAAAALVDAAVGAAVAAVAAAKDADIDRMQAEIARLQSQLADPQLSAHRLAQQAEAEGAADADDSAREQSFHVNQTETETSQDHVAVEEDTLRLRHAHLAHSYQTLHKLFLSLQTEHGWLLSGLIFFIRSLSEMYDLEKKRDEVKEKVIALRKEYDALSHSIETTPDGNTEEVHALKNHLQSLSIEIKNAQKSYVTYRDLLLRLREDLESFLAIYTNSKMEELSNKKWNDSLPEVDVEGEIEIASKPVTITSHRGSVEQEEALSHVANGWANGLNQSTTGSAAASASVARELNLAKEALTTLQEQHTSLQKAHALAQEDLKYDDEIFEEKIRAIKDLTSKEKAAQEQIQHLKEANKKLATMMREMGEEVVRKLNAGNLNSSVPNTARSNKLEMLTARGGTPSATSTGLNSARSPLLALMGNKSNTNTMTHGTGGTESSPFAPEFFRRNTEALAREQEEQDEMLVAHEGADESFDGSTPFKAGGAGSRNSSRPGTAAASARRGGSKDSQEIAELRHQYYELRSQYAQLHTAYASQVQSLNGLGAHISSRKSAHGTQQKQLEKELRDVRIQIEMKRNALEDIRSAVKEARDRVNAPAPSQIRSPSRIRAQAEQQLKQAEERYMALEQELALKQRLLSALSPRAIAKTDPQHNVRRGIESDVRELEQALKEAGDNLEQMQLGASGPQQPVPSASDEEVTHLLNLEEEAKLIEAELAQLVGEEADYSHRNTSAQADYQSLHDDDKQNYQSLQQEVENIQRDIQLVENELDRLRGELKKRGVDMDVEDELDNAQGTFDIQLTSASGSKRPLTSAAGGSAFPSARAAGGAAASLPTSPAQLQSLKRKTQWLEHQVSTYLDEHAQLEALAEAQREAEKVRVEKEKLEAQKRGLLAKSMRASGMGSMTQLLATAAASRPATAKSSAQTAKLSQSLLGVEQTLNGIDARSSRLLRQSQTIRSMHSPTATSATKDQLRSLQDELDTLAQQRAQVESQRQMILSQLTESKRIDVASSASAMEDSQIVDGTMLNAILSEEDKQTLAVLDETIDDFEAQMEFKAERMEEMRKEMEGMQISRTPAKPAASSTTVSRPGTAAAALTRVPGAEEASLDSHRQVFLQKALAMFDPADPAESAYIAKEFVALRVEKAKLEAEAAAERKTLQMQLEEKEAHLAEMERHISLVLEENENRLANQEKEWQQKFTLMKLEEAKKATAAHLAPTHNTSASNTLQHAASQPALSSNAPMSKSPDLKLKTLKSHMAAHRQSQQMSSTSQSQASVGLSATHSTPPLSQSVLLRMATSQTHSRVGSAGVTQSQIRNPNNTQPNRNVNPSNHFGPRSYSPNSSAMMTVNTPLLYNQSPSATPRTLTASHNHLSPTRSTASSTVGSPSRDHYFNSSQNPSHRSTTSNTSSTGEPRSPTSLQQKLRSLHQQQLLHLPEESQQSSGNSSANNSRLNSPSSSSTLSAEERQKMQLSLLKKKQGLRNSMTHQSSTSSLHSQQSQSSLHSQSQSRIPQYTHHTSTNPYSSHFVHRSDHDESVHHTEDHEHEHEEGDTDREQYEQTEEVEGDDGELEGVEDHEVEDFSRSNNFLSARSNLPPPVGSQGKLKEYGVPQLKLGLGNKPSDADMKAVGRVERVVVSP